MIIKSFDEEKFRINVISKLGLWIGIFITIAVIPRYIISKISLTLLVINLVIGLLFILFSYKVKKTKGKSIQFYGYAIFIGIILIGLNSGFGNGGIKAPATITFIITPLIAFLCVGKRGALVALFGSIASILILLIADHFDFIKPVVDIDNYNNYKSYIDIVGCFCCFAAASAYESIRIENEKKLNMNLSFLHLITNSSPLAFLVVDNRTDEILYFNHKFCEIWGITEIEEKMRSKLLKNNDIIPFCLPVLVDIPAFAESCKPLQSENNRIVIEDEIPFINNRTIRRFSSQIRGTNDEYFGRLYIFEEVTERKNAILEQEKHRSQMIATAKKVALGEMASAMGHEINNPLAIISGKVSILSEKSKKNILDKQYLEDSLMVVQRTVDRIVKIITGLRNLSRNSDDDPMIETPVASIIENTLELCYQTFKHTNIELKVEMESNLTIFGRAAQISQILMNLLNNAFHAVQDHDVKWVLLKIKELDDFIEFRVSDSGPKIPLEVQEKMMQPFFTTKSFGKGTGLGLSISLSIAKSHNGELYYNKNSENTEFILKIPKAKLIKSSIAV